MNPPASPPKIGPNNNTTTSSSFDSKRQPKENQFISKHGQRHHSFDPEKAPYPVSYDRYVLELESLGLQLIRHVGQSVSFVDFEDGPPTRCLDLGCGHGTWVIDAAKEWPDCHFVGFDLVNVQLPLKMVDPSIAERIQWLHGNFLTTKLPFEEDEFDHVHIHSIARGVPENKWGVLFEEVHRVLKPGGVVEVAEDDILFPLLPRWFTAPLRVRTRRAASVHYPEGSQRIVDPAPSVSNVLPPHDHALLESLYHSVFESRFINLRPTAILPIYFTTYFRHVILGPIINFPMPPLPPIQPLPQQIPKSYADAFPTDASTTSMDVSQPRLTRPASVSFSSTISSLSTQSAISNASSSSSTVGGQLPASSTSDDDHAGKDDHPSPAAEDISPMKWFTTDTPISDNDSSSKSLSKRRIRLDRLQSLSERSLAMNLYRAYQNVLSCQEAMWEELKDRLRNRKDQLKQYGWDDDEELEELQSRSKFERIIERYRGDMQTRVALWASLASFGWPTPQREPLSKAELIEEERVRRAMIEARKQASQEDFKTACRSMRVLIGYKSCG